jgi:hypothetical protein
MNALQDIHAVDFFAMLLPTHCLPGACEISVQMPSKSSL